MIAIQDALSDMNFTLKGVPNELDAGYTFTLCYYDGNFESKRQFQTSIYCDFQHIVDIVLWLRNDLIKEKEHYYLHGNGD